MNTETLLSKPSPLWKSQLTRWLRQENPNVAETRGAVSPTRRAPQASERKTVAPAPPVWPRVFPGL